MKDPAAMTPKGKKVGVVEEKDFVTALMREVERL